MDLLSDWWRRTLGAAAGAVVVPVAVLVAALAVGLGGGGLGGLGVIGQALSGPEDAGEDLAAVRPDASDAARAARLLARASTPAPPAGGSAAPVTAPDAGAPAPAPGAGPVPGEPPAAGVPGPVPGGPPGTPQPAPPTPAPTAAPTATPGTVRQVGDAVKQVTDPLPLAGAPAGQVVDLLVDTIEQLPDRRWR